MSVDPVAKLHAAVQSAKSADDLLSALRDYYIAAMANADGYIATSKVVTDCRAGCSFCCYLRVGVRAHEAFVIADFVRANFSPNELQSLIGRLQEHVVQTSPLSEGEHIGTNFKCPMLVDSKCSVYPVRPLACRGYHSLAVSSCRYSFENPRDTIERRPSDPTLDSLWEMMAGRCHGIYELEGYDSKSYELGFAVLQALTNPAAKKRWKKGKKAFPRPSGFAENRQP